MSSTSFAYKNSESNSENKHKNEKAEHFYTSVNPGTVKLSINPLSTEKEEDNSDDEGFLISGAIVYRVENMYRILDSQYIFNEKNRI
ncbi:hypothetical protein [Wolbachia endosymbiont of Bemisia tabaci]|uniref:hypothetical protein n=1 Tax=Wolbachia endosymbiont of Bemisia tabaci TaxID=215173 RepID=UPI000D555563|nr:hypothetical protein [Wolbachia endosymbiont of Bemisia tabaci]